SVKGAGPPGLTGKRVGIFGLGEIGRRIAKRAAAFDTQISYTARVAKTDVPWSFIPDITSLARAVDVLFIAASGGGETEHIVNAGVLNALGPQGYLINIARGSLVDSEALAAALKSRSIAGAALDVVEGEPTAPSWANGLDNLVLTPHLAGWSPDARKV